MSSENHNGALSAHTEDDPMSTATHHSRVVFQDLEKPARVNETFNPVPAASPQKPESPPPTSEKATSKSKNVDITEHLMTIDEVSQKYSTLVNTTKPADSTGISQAQAAKGLVEYGPNVLTPPKTKHPIILYLECVAGLFNLLLILAGILQYVLLAIDPVENQANIYLGAILIVVALLNAFIEFFQMLKSAAILASFLNMIPAKCFAIREGKLAQMSAAELIPGDVVFTRMGDKIPADLLIFHSSDMKVDNSSLTGESEPQARVPFNDQRSPLEASNIAFNGTLVVAGEGYGIVIRTGDNTVLGQIAGLTQGEKKRKSPLSLEIDNFVKTIAGVAAFTAIVFFIVGQVLYGKISFTLNFAIGVFVAFVPEGLPATVTMLLTIAAKRMAAANVLVKDLKGVETLGAITLLATDKTGTLTRNQMTVTNVWSGLVMYTAFPSSGNPEIPLTADAPGVDEIMHNASLNSRAKFDRVDVPIEERQILGDATESGLVRFAAKNLNDFDNIAATYPKVFEIPFNSDNKWAMTIHEKVHANGDLTLFIKGAPERILRLCSTILINGEAIPLTQEHKDLYDQTYAYMAGKGHRVLAFAQLLLPRDQYPLGTEFTKEKKNYPTSELCFVGLTSLEDPPKHGVREAIGSCRSAGIQVMMVTGDHPLTAEAIGRKINIMLSETKEMVAKRTGRPIESIQEHEYSAIVIHGEQIDSLTEQDWDIIFSKNEIIFARTSPKHKLEIVRHAQAMGHIVGVTGDGVNDSPALKKADLGIAMNQSGSDVSKEAAAMILLDDNFASTVKGVNEGRLIFTNLKKSIQYTITHSTPEILPNLLYIIVPLPLPLSAILILVIDLGFEMFAALSYAWEYPETKSGLMKLPPRKPVTVRSVARLRRQLSRRPQSHTDIESGAEFKPSKFSLFKHSITEKFTSQYWVEMFEETDDEVLVDAGVLSWGYLEAGMIEFVGAILSYFLVLWFEFNISPSEARNMQKNNCFQKDSDPYTLTNGTVLDATQQKEALSQAQSIYYLSVMIMQCFNLFACKCRIRLPFGKYMFKNKMSFIGLTIGAAIALLVVYVPPFNVVFGTSYHLSPKWWLVSVGFGILLFFYSCVRRIIARKRKPISWNPDIVGLQMYPTVRTVKSTGTTGK
ncbi:P-type cation exchange, alpha subunit of ATPase [Basidiobolus meristosporus CBS 931.73]|uniref:P-type cation exchange, alpha subunit of ATPase n=1 Tax=Basidiobolus meristosporus CBS 931.73 TaxID=1314790 RepID=A0A1Y1YU47_9FUNG|nr:P-type cation exchange, alpha subunit of ATPase [Basidiobolus meristosporus CBS 931.73]|eukprot:ORY01095.1 P-type cation exchange, alpha subunit of ATPase [Basidiobolus meristosporus CBS 931.73]